MTERRTPIELTPAELEKELLKRAKAIISGRAQGEDAAQVFAALREKYGKNQFSSSEAVPKRRAEPRKGPGYSL